MAEAGLPGYQVEAWWGLFGPAGLSPAVLRRLNDELTALITSPSAVEMLARDGATPRPGRPEDLGEAIRAEGQRMRKLIQDARITAD